MFEFGIVIHVILALLILMFWRKARGHSLDDIFGQNAASHHRVNEFHTAEPVGATWKQHQKWMKEAAPH